jgi:phosphatidylethanolamine/phosphatidyl-N-methylethanolamine N-methyltransferase
MGFLNECGTFWRESRHHFKTVGAVLPSSRFLARALASPLNGPRPDWHVLEAGPGTGSVTREILRRLRPSDRLDIVELNDQFVQRLNDCFQHDPRFAPHRHQVTIIHGPVQEVAGEDRYDAIVSGLPLNNFPVELVQEVFSAFTRLVKPGGILSYFEYEFVRQLKTPFVNRAEKQRLDGVGQLVGSYIRNFEVQRKRVLMNVPPAIARCLRLKPSAEGTDRPVAHR